MQEKQRKRDSIDDQRRDFLNRAKKYYRDKLKFRLFEDDKGWQRIVQLYHLRNGIAHSNGRFAMMNKRTRKKIRTIQGVSEKVGCVVVDATYLRETFNLVRGEIEALTARYKQWDTDNRRRWLCNL